MRSWVAMLLALGVGLAERSAAKSVTDEPPAQTALPDPLPPGWRRPEPEHLAKPTFWPSVLALGIVLLLWGAITTIAISAVGVVVCALAVAYWVGDIRHEP